MIICGVITCSCEQIFSFQAAKEENQMRVSILCSRCYKEHDVTNFPIEEENEK